MPRVDLHTHSEASPDGGITAAQYRQLLDSGQLDFIAITDHNRIDFALKIQQELGDQIIVGEEIMTSNGEIIGLYLHEKIEPNLTPLEAVKHIKDQNGLVYIPHPFEIARKGLKQAILEEIADFVDIIEICNGRALLPHRSAQAAVWTKLHRKAGAASSDAHGRYGIGRTYTELADAPSRDALLQLLGNATPRTATPTVRALLYPKYHRLRKHAQGLHRR